MTLTTRADQFTLNASTTGWGCPDQREPGIEDVVWAAIMQISKEWIKHGRVGGFDQGEFRVDTAGNISPEPVR